MKRPLCMVCLLFCLLWGCFQSRAQAVDFSYRDGEILTIRGRIYEEEIRETKIRLFLTDVLQETEQNQFKDVSSAQFQPIHTNIILYVEKDAKYRVGETVIVKGSFLPFEEGTNPGQFDSKSYYNRMGIGFSLTDVSITKRSQSVKIWDYLPALLKRKWIQVYQQYGGAQADTFISMLLGQRSYMTQELKEMYQRNGIAHIFAISGLHISFLGLFLFKLGKKLHLLRGVNFVLVLFCMSFYGKMTGMSVSTVRAIIMLILLLLAELLGRSYDMLTAMSVSLLCIIIKSPGMIMNSGFQLSFVCVLALGMEMPAFLADVFSLEKAPKTIRKILQALTTSLGVSVFTLPILLSSYYSFSPYSVFLNLIIIPFLSLVLMFGMLGGIWGMIMPVGADLLLRPAEWILCGYEQLCSLADQLPGNVVVVGKPSLWQMVLYYGVLCTTLVLYQNRQRKGESKGFANDKRGQSSTLLENGRKVVTNSVFGKIRMGTANSVSGKARMGTADSVSGIVKRGAGSAEQKIRAFKRGLGGIVFLMILFGILVLPIQIGNSFAYTVTMLDVGQGDCLCLQLGGKVFLIDGGSSSETEIAKYKIEPFLKSKGIGKVDAVLVSHPDADHMNGAIDCLNRSRQSGIHFKQLILTEYASRHSAEYEEILRAAEYAACHVSYIGEEDYMTDREDFVMTCLHPAKGAEYSDVNDSSMVLYLKCRGKTFLFTGDISGEVEAEIVEKLAKAGSVEKVKKMGIAEDTVFIDFLKVAHHGSHNSTGEAFLQKIHPRIALISAGKDNSYGHPHKETLERLEEYGVKVLRTDKSGAVEVRLPPTGRSEQ